jgi:hypothetical protein
MAEIGREGKRCVRSGVGRSAFAIIADEKLEHSICRYGPTSDVGLVSTSVSISVILRFALKLNNARDISSFFRFFVDQHILLPFTGFLVSAVNAAYPTAWAFLTFKKFF